MTDLYGILAHPVAHSLSPAMHNAAFQAMALDARFEAFDVRPDELEAFMTQRTDIQGLAVSIPHKERIAPFLDEIEPIAQRIGAVNTVFWQEGKRWGTNTDAPGFLDVLRPEMPQMKGRSALVLGAGGAARAVVAALTEEGVEVRVMNRNPEKARALETAFGATVVEGWDQVPDLLELVVNATPVGLHPEQEVELVPRERWKPGMIAFDVVYRPDATTRFIQQARTAGAIVLEGKAMLLHQGVRQFERWTSLRAPIEVMRAALR